MNKIIENSKRILTLVLIAAVAFVATTTITRAVADTITVGEAEDIPAYIGGVTFATKTTSDGKYLYCLEMSKKTTRNTTVKLGEARDAGIANIILNGYPNKSITGDRLKDYYITQTALWWYLDEVTGSTNLGEQFKSEGDDSYGMRQYVKSLVDGGLEALRVGYPTTSLSVNVEKNSVSIATDYYESEAITVSTTANEYTVTLEGATENTKIISTSSNEEKATFNKDEKFIIRVPANEITKSTLNIKVIVSVTGVVYKAYEYVPTDSTMQAVTPGIIEPTEEKVSTSIDLELTTTKVSVTKYDANTNNPLPGAKLVLKNSAGEEITSWTSTNNSHVIRNLTAGVYTVSETEAPTGYELSKDVVTFTISKDSDVQEIRLDNYSLEKTVVNITKISSETGNALAGAVMVVKDSEGKEVERFTTTEEAHVITGLAYGTYTLSEVSAPAGYKISDEVMTFTLDDDHTSYQIKFANYKEFAVPDTSTSSIIFKILGIAIIGSGLGFIYRNAKRA